MGGGKKSKSLSNALASQQARLKKKAQAEHSAQQRLKQEATKGRGKGKAPPPRNVIPFAATDRILLIGEGNFSFTRALVFDPPAIPSSSYALKSLEASSSHPLEFLPPANVTATAYDTEDECYAKYPEATDIVYALREKGVEILFGVDATKLEKCASLKGRRFDRIVWNFPHTGKGIADQDRNILSNQTLILDFLRSVPHVLEQGSIPTVPSRQKKGADEDDDDVPMEDEEVNDGTAKVLRGTVLITLRNVPPYTLWDVPKLAKSPPPPRSKAQPLNPRYKLLRSFAFHRKTWKDYEHRMTKGERAGGTGTAGMGGEDRTWEFCLAEKDA